ncbi:MAG: hypothetical protein RM338_06575 [Nostoc sp. DedQUE12a]|nr:hypothetical protein [Nostoc sp. DedQUE12a]
MTFGERGFGYMYRFIRKLLLPTDYFLVSYECDRTPATSAGSRSVEPIAKHCEIDNLIAYRVKRSQLYNSCRKSSAVS